MTTRMIWTLAQDRTMTTTARTLTILMPVPKFKPSTTACNHSTANSHPHHNLKPPSPPSAAEAGVEGNSPAANAGPRKAVAAAGASTATVVACQSEAAAVAEVEKLAVPRLRARGRLVVRPGPGQGLVRNGTGRL